MKHKIYIGHLNKGALVEITGSLSAGDTICVEKVIENVGNYPISEKDELTIQIKYGMHPHLNVPRYHATRES